VSIGDEFTDLFGNGQRRSQVLIFLAIMALGGWWPGGSKALSRFLQRIVDRAVHRGGLDRCRNYCASDRRPTVVFVPAVRAAARVRDLDRIR
jgi:hypothetical protein